MEVVMSKYAHSLSDFAEVLTPRSLSQFLGTQSWALHSERTFMETWVHDPGAGHRLDYVHIPTDFTDVDFDKRLYEATTEIASVFDWSISELAEKVAAIHADLFFVRVTQASADGTIPLHRASELIDSIEKMVRTAAIITSNPQASGKGRKSERVKTFLENDLRMGHTKRGSFIITIAARLDEGSIGTNSGTDSPAHDALQASKPEPDQPPTDAATAAAPVTSGPGDSDSGPQLDFSRRVMTTLSRGLDATRRHLDDSDDFLEFAEARSDGMTSQLVEAIEEIADGFGGNEVDMSFNWTPSVPQDEPVVDRVVFSRRAIDKIPAVVERFNRAEVEPLRETIVGPVIALSRDITTLVAETGDVTIQADVQGSVKRVGVTLSGHDYNWAIYAHRNKYPFTVTGLLGKKGRSWHLIEPIETDTRFLKERRRELIERQGGDAPEDIQPPND